MSAYDWKECELCQKKKSDILKRMKKERKTLTDVEYEELLEEYDNYEDDDRLECVRHDQEVYLDDDGNMCGNISMSCEKCEGDWSITFKVKSGEDLNIG